MRSRLATIASLVAFLSLSATAHGDVLVSRPISSIRCGETIRTGVWYRPFPTRGKREASIEIRSADDAVLWRRRVAVTGDWRYFRYTPRCGRHYRVYYVTAAGTTTFRVWVRKR